MMDTGVSRKILRQKLMFQVFWIFSIPFIDAESIYNVRLQITPEVVEKGNQTTLKCNYDLNGEPLYSVKWYRGNHEFYQYSPKENPSIRTFNHSWIDIDLEKSNESQVTLKNVGFHLTGNFSCEITTDAPYFSTASSYRVLNVVHFPQDKPVIVSEYNKYERPGQILHVNCTFPLSKPTAQLSFTINNISIPKLAVKRLDRNTNLNEQKIIMSLNLLPKHFHRGQLNLRCLAEIPRLLSQSSEVQLGAKLNDPVPARVTSNAGAGIGAENGITAFVLVVSVSITLSQLVWR